MFLCKNSGVDIIMVIFGRLKDFFFDNIVNFGDVMFVVFDEVDCMLDKGFEDDIKLILGGCLLKEEC